MNDETITTTNASPGTLALESLVTEDMYLVEPEIVTSSGRKVPKRNPKAKAWVSPYGNRRK
jgi:hypothetical protein